MLHGTEDPLVDVARARETRQILERLGVDLTYQEFAMGHEIRPEALSVVAEWLRDRGRTTIR